jgi:hypothetical protein
MTIVTTLAGAVKLRDKKCIIQIAHKYRGATNRTETKHATASFESIFECDNLIALVKRGRITILSQLFW